MRPVDTAAGIVVILLGVYYLTPWGAGRMVRYNEKYADPRLRFLAPRTVAGSRVAALCFVAVGVAFILDL